MRDDPAGDAAELIRRIEGAGFRVSVHHMREYVELHAVQLSGDGPARVARCEGDGDAELYQAVRALASMLGVTA